MAFNTRGDPVTAIEFQCNSSVQYHHHHHYSFNDKYFQLTQPQLESPVNSVGEVPTVAPPGGGQSMIATVPEIICTLAPRKLDGGSYQVKSTGISSQFCKRHSANPPKLQYHRSCSLCGNYEYMSLYRLAMSWSTW